MKTSVFLYLLCLLLFGCGQPKVQPAIDKTALVDGLDTIDLSLVQAEEIDGFVEVPIGTTQKGIVRLPPFFFHQNEYSDTLFVMPSKVDADGPISLRISCIRDLNEDGFDIDMTREFLRGCPGGDKIQESAGYLLVSSEQPDCEDEVDPSVRWHLRQFTIVHDGLVFTMTIWTLKGREHELQSQLLRDQVARIISTLSRAP